MITVEEFHAEFFQQVLRSADADGRFLEDAFFEEFTEQIVESGDLETADRAHYVADRGVRVDGYAYDPASDAGTLTLVVQDFNQEASVVTMDQRRLLATFRRTQAFLEKSLSAEFRNSLEESTPAFGLSDLIAQRWSGIRRVRLMLMTNRVLSTRIDGLKAGELHGRQLTYSVWDLGRLHRFAEVGGGREEIEVDFPAQFGAGLPALRAHLPGATYGAYLAVIPGSQLAEIYGKWGSRLLEQNVRAYLQARGAVNRGIRNTLEQQPEMFLAYNNGITATAESVETESDGDGLRILRIRNLQVVNGGQTTASIHAASLRPDADLSKVFVQMKLSIIDPAVAMDVVPKISEYANSQNRVNAADFFSNHPFHVRVEEFSRQISAPSPDGTFTESKWFYERARGQYQDARAHLTAARRARFDLEFPKSQMFVKTDLAKFLNTWRGYPHMVSAGAQKNFVSFAEYIGKEWDRDNTQFSQQFFRDTIAKAIIFRRAEKLISGQTWYTGGYRANIVTYAIAKLVYDSTRRERAVDLSRVWREQGLWEGLEQTLGATAEVVNGILLQAPGNVTEFAKQQACWKRVQDASVTWPEAMLDVLPTLEEWREVTEAGRDDQVILNGIEAQRRVLEAGSEFWAKVQAWAQENGALTETENGILNVARSIPAKLPTERQSQRLLQALTRYEGLGCPVGR